jgi:hypothetical protein
VQRAPQRGRARFPPRARGTAPGPGTVVKRTPPGAGVSAQYEGGVRGRDFLHAPQGDLPDGVDDVLHEAQLPIQHPPAIVQDLHHPVIPPAT